MSSSHGPGLLLRHPAGRALVVFLVAITVRAIFFWQMWDSFAYRVLICDALAYDRWAWRIASGDWLGSGVFYQTPLYPYSLAVVYSLFGHHVWAARIVQALLGSFACVFLAQAGERFFSPRVGWIVGLIMAIYPPALFFDGILQKASLDLFLMSALLWAIGECQFRWTAPRLGPRLLTLAAVGGLVGLLVLNRENAAVFVPVVLLWTLWLTARRSLRAAFVPTTVLLLATAAVLLPVGLRNYYVGGEFLLTTSQMGPNFFIGNHRNADGQYAPLRPYRGDPRYESYDARVLAEQDRKRPLSPSEVSSYWLERTWRDIQGDPTRWIALLAKKAFLTFQAAEVVDAEGIQGHARESTMLFASSRILHFGVLCPLAAVGIWLTRSSWRTLWILYVMLLSFAAAVTLFYVFARYRYPLVPIVALFAAAGGVALWDRLLSPNSQHWWDIPVSLALFLAVAVGCNWPLPSVGNDDHDTTLLNVGSGLRDQGQPKDAIEPLEALRKRKPREATVYVHLGQCYKALNDLPRARRYFEQAVELNPNHSVALLNLGLTCLSQGRPAEAAVHLARSVQIEPLNTDTQLALSKAERALGRADDGFQRLVRTVQTDRSSARARAEYGGALIARQQILEGIEQFREAIKLDPYALDAANNLAYVLAAAPDQSIRNPKEASDLSLRVCDTVSKEDPLYPSYLDTLAVAQAAAGNFQEAVKTIRGAIDMARSSHNDKLADSLEDRRRLFEQSQPYLDESLKLPRS